MDKGEVLEIILRFQQALEGKGIEINKLVLFGSYATGQFREGSDIDVVVISDSFTGKGYWERIDILSDAIYEVFAPVEAVGMTPDEWEKKDSFIADYARNGEIVYAT